MSAPYHITSIDESLRDRIATLLTNRCGSTQMVSRGCSHDLTKLNGFIALSNDTIQGLATYDISNDACEIVSLDSFVEGGGIGSALLIAVEDTARAKACCKVWMITSNGNINALRFYQRRGYRLVAVHRDAIKSARAIKPEIPEVGDFGIPIVDEIELEKRLS